MFRTQIAFAGTLPDAEPLLDQVRTHHTMWMGKAELTETSP